MNLITQWHITEQCNWRCTHCYHEGYLDEWPDLNILKNTFEQIVEIKKNYFWLIVNKYVNFAWWEPFLKKEFLDLLEYINDRNIIKNIGILTNWSLINQKLLDRLKKFKNLKFRFQMSLEWEKKVNDLIRWKWTFEIVKDKIKLLRQNNIEIRISFTLTTKNQNELIKLIPFIQEFNINLWVRRIVPMWQSNEEYNLMLSQEEWYKLSIKYFNINKNILKWKWTINLSWCSEITWYKYKWYWCWINDNRVLTIMHNLDVYACRRLPIIFGNLKKDKLNNILNWNKYLEFVKSHNYIELCKKCPYVSWCKWWAKCITYAKNKTLKMEDPQCYFAILMREKNNKK